MIKKIKALIFNKFIRFAPKFFQDRYIRKMVLVPTEQLNQEFPKAIAYLKKSSTLGDYLEFGVFRGSSLLCMHRALEKMNAKNVRLFGFDSFEGLPNSSNAHDNALPWYPGEFRTSYEGTKDILDKSGVDWKRVFLIKGWYSKVLNQKLIRKHKINNVSLIMIDCDLYSSSKEALDFCGPLIKDKAIIFFDDWDAGEGLAKKNLGERKAFEDFLSQNPQFKAKEFGSYHHTEQENPFEAKIFLVTKKAK